jgi:hypothetical protein
MKQFNKYERKEQVEFELLPKGAYVIKILSIKEEESPNKGINRLKIAFDIAEGEYKDFYKNMFENNTKEDKKWPNDAVIYIISPSDDSEQWIIDNFNKFMTALEDSNNDYHWNWDENTLKNKLVGAKFCIEQSEFDGKIYDHTRARWFIAAQKVRDGKYGKLPADKLLNNITSNKSNSPANDGFMPIPDEEIPF